jgi:hypothetical protein
MSWLGYYPAHGRSHLNSIRRRLLGDQDLKEALTLKEKFGLDE